MLLDDFLYPHRRPQVAAATQAQAFEADLETFAQQVSYICNLEAGGKLSPADAYQRLQEHWQHLQQSKEAAGIC